MRLVLIRVVISLTTFTNFLLVIISVDDSSFPMPTRELRHAKVFAKGCCKDSGQYQGLQSQNYFINCPCGKITVQFNPLHATILI